MKRVRVIGTRGANCHTTVKLVEELAQQENVPIEVKKVQTIEGIVASGLMRTPGVIVDGKVVHAGGVPKREAIAGWLQAG